MSSPFSSIGLTAQPSWTASTAPNGNFSLLNITGAITIPEVGYGEGGYGEGGYDAPELNIPGSAAPNWSVYATK